MSIIDYSALFDEFDSQLELQPVPTQDEIFGLEEIRSNITRVDGQFFG